MRGVATSGAVDFHSNPYTAGVSLRELDCRTTRHDLALHIASGYVLRGHHAQEARPANFENHNTVFAGVSVHNLHCSTYLFNWLP